MTNSLPLAWAINPAFFWAGCALVAIPIIIHLLNRRRFKVVRWAAMEFLLAALRKNRRRIRFEQIILLATRCALLALLGLALARPYGCQQSTIANLAGQRTGLHVFVIDNSYSMAYEAERPGARTHLDQAKILARRYIERLSAGGESVAIITAGAPAAMVIGKPTYDLEAARAAVDRIEQSAGATDLAGALQLAVQVAREQQQQPRRLLYLLTDATRSAWDTAQTAAIQQAAAEAARVFRSPAIVHHLEKPDQWNHAVLDLRPGENLLTTRSQGSFVATLQAFGGGVPTVVQWKLNEQVLPGSATVRLENAPSELVQANLHLKEGGPAVVSVSLVNDERLKLDNTRWRVADVASELKVLIVEGERGGGPLSGSGAFLEAALSPQKPQAETGTRRTDSYISPETISDLELANKVLAEHRAVILTNVGQIAPAQADQLQKYVRQGGTLMLFMGEQVNREHYNTVMLSRKLMPGKLIARRSAASDGRSFNFDFNPHGVLHPLLSIFRNRERSGLDTADILTYWQIEPSADIRPEVVLAYKPQEGKSTGDPGITVHALGKGRVVFVSTSANTEWTTLQAKPCFVPLVHELLAGSVNVPDRWMNLQPGDPVRIPPTLKLSGAPRLLAAGGQSIPITPTLEDGQTVYRSDPLTRPGLYRLSTGLQTYPIAVNVSADEADIRPVPPDAIRKALRELDVRLEGDSFPGEALAKLDARDFGWTIMAIVLGLAAVECLMAMRFGHYRRGGVNTGETTTRS